MDQNNQKQTRPPESTVFGGMWPNKAAKMPLYESAHAADQALREFLRELRQLQEKYGVRDFLCAGAMNMPEGHPHPARFSECGANGKEGLALTALIAGQFEWQCLRRTPEAHAMLCNSIAAMRDYCSGIAKTGVNPN